MHQNQELLNYLRRESLKLEDGKTLMETIGKYDEALEAGVVQKGKTEKLISDTDEIAMQKSLGQQKEHYDIYKARRAAVAKNNPDMSAEAITQKIAKEEPAVYAKAMEYEVAAKKFKEVQNQRIFETVDEILGDHPEVADVVKRYVLDEDHPMGIVSHLKDPKRRKMVLDELKELADEKPLSEAQFKALAEKPIMMVDNDAQFNVIDGRKSTDVLAERLIKENELLYSIGDHPSAAQKIALDKYAKKLKTETLPSLQSRLEGVAGAADGSGFPTVSSRAKDGPGLVDKIQRMRKGNPREMKAGRPNYKLADVPDAVGGRITVRSEQDLPEVMARLEKEFGAENIFEKDNFYLNKKKRQRPYRVITYTVRVDGVPCEIQITTLRSSIAADLWHNTGYKKYHPDLPSTSIDRMEEIQKAAAATEHRKLASEMAEAA